MKSATSATAEVAAEATGLQIVQVASWRVRAAEATRMPPRPAGTPWRACQVARNGPRQWTGVHAAGIGSVPAAPQPSGRAAGQQDAGGCYAATAAGGGSTGGAAPRSSPSGTGTPSRFAVSI